MTYYVDYKFADSVQVLDTVSVDMGYGPREHMEWCTVVKTSVYQSLFDTTVIRLRVRRYNGEFIDCSFDPKERIDVRRP